MSINYFMENIKQFLSSDKGKDILTVFIVILVGLLSFGLGRLSKNIDQEGLKIQYVDQGLQTGDFVSLSQFEAQNEPNPIQTSNSSEKAFFASSRGQKYYPRGCSAGKSIKMENRVYFDTEEEAQKAGFERSSSCS